MFEPGTSLPNKKRFKFTNFLVAGGYADIYLGVDTWRNNRKVAIKVYKKDKFDNIEQVQYYLRREMAFLDIQDDYSANTVDLIDHIIDPENELYVLIMSYIQGPDFEEYYSTLLAEGNPEPNIYYFLVKFIFIPLAEFLSYCHHHGVLHRDLSAGNILISTQQGKIIPVLIDWGAALNYDPAKIYQTPALLKDCKPSEEMQIYTSSYNPPEINECIGLLPQSDIYSFGSIMYYAFTKGTYRERATNPEDYVASPKKINKQCPSMLDKMVRKCTQYEPRDRYISFDELKEDLNKYIKRSIKVTKKHREAKRKAQRLRRAKLLAKSKKKTQRKFPAKKATAKKATAKKATAKKATAKKATAKRNHAKKV
jgi:serine/threonine protein kinase